MIALRARLALGGSIVLIIGLLLAVYGGQTVIKDIYTTRTDPLADLAFEIEESTYWPLDRRITQPSSIEGKASVLAGATGQPSDISFFVLDSVNFEKWRQHQPAVSYIVKLIEVSDRFSFNFTASRNDTYHFVFDNYYSTVKKTVKFQVTSVYGAYEKKAVLDQTLNYVGVAIVGVGAITAIYGFVAPAELIWSKQSAML